MYNNIRIKSPPAKVYWAGWESNTLNLARAGWDISIVERPERADFYMALRHPQGNVYGRSQSFTRHLLMDEYFKQRQYLDLGFQMSLAYEIRVHESGDMGSTNWFSVDATPTYVEERITNFSTMDIFNTINPSAERINLREASLLEVLEIARSKQEPMQEKIRKRILRDRGNELVGLKPNTDLCAQLRLVA